MRKILVLFILLPFCSTSQDINSNTVNIEEVMRGMDATDLFRAGTTIVGYVLKSRGGPKCLPVKPHSEYSFDEMTTDYILACNEKCFIINNYYIYKLEDFLSLEFEKDKQNIVFVKTYAGFFTVREYYFMINIFFLKDKNKWTYTYEKIDIHKKVKLPSGSKLHFAHPKK